MKSHSGSLTVRAWWLPFSPWPGSGPLHWRRADFIPRLALAVLAIRLFVVPAQGQLLGPSPESDIQQGAQVAKLVEQQIGLYLMPKTEAYLREVGDRLVAVVNDPRWKFTFQVVNQSEPNAFAIP